MFVLVNISKTAELISLVYSKNIIFIYRNALAYLKPFKKNQLIVPNKKWRHVIQIINDKPVYILPLDNYNALYTGLSLVICILWRHFLAL